MTFHTARIVLSCTALTAAIVTGCAKSELPPIGANDYFRPDDEPRNVDNIFAQQRANGAREDGTLYTQHFTDGKLNSLGYAKLSAMAGGDNGKLAIFIDVPKGDAYTAAQDSVIKGAGPRRRRREGLHDHRRPEPERRWQRRRQPRRSRQAEEGRRR
ncbi:MAG: hypothetical protein QM754_19280 [Tepidisphaeraceae bacterium]